ncbi:hypothetical protein [Acinetobacter baumannii]|uniref:hypothetical protein n=1 Tax=Acinetobacter baumannii TaxID=470 RepID=UPI00044826C1|nr:hypothetical protein [Acinetobacter baumannii]EKT8141426.1 hypothetical protein [Acinetobacter baumannii]EKU7083967.1 hypothetical protein [Acinetobacter baumannii]EKV1039804.1 hypothetical protein [Acinetobacter baumannii]EKV1043531.1 hypothetical protein [Acinetobacter baumannii]EKV1918649.1 hypothetical protein [Acinetobacter baumannii]
MSNLLTELLDSLLIANNKGEHITAWNLSQDEYEILMSQIVEYGLYDKGVNDEHYLAGIEIFLTS